MPPGTAFEALFGDLKDPLAPVHPGEILLEEFIKPYGLSRSDLPTFSRR